MTFADAWFYIGPLVAGGIGAWSTHAFADRREDRRFRREMGAKYGAEFLEKAERAIDRRSINPPVSPGLMALGASADQRKELQAWADALVLADLEVSIAGRRTAVFLSEKGALAVTAFLEEYRRGMSLEDDRERATNGELLKLLERFGSTLREEVRRPVRE